MDNKIMIRRASCYTPQQAKQRPRPRKASHRLRCSPNGRCTPIRSVQLGCTLSVAQEVWHLFVLQKCNVVEPLLECRAHTAIRPSCACCTVHNKWLVRLHYALGGA